MKKKTLLPLTLLLIGMLLSACSSSGLPQLPTPRAPSILDINNAAEVWKSTRQDSYFAEVQEITLEGTRQIRVVVKDGQIRNAQALTLVDNKFADPIPLSIEEAQNYTIDAIFDKIRQDALSNGPVPVNLDVIFDPSNGYPSVVKAEALPTYGDNNKLNLNRQYNYQFTVTVDALLEDIFGIGKEPIFTYTRLGGPEADCDVLRIYADRNSIYSNECDRTLLQLNPPVGMMDELNSLAENFSGMDLLEEEGEKSQHLIILGTGAGSPDTPTQTNSLALAEELMDLLSRPVGFGLTLIFSGGSQVWGIDMQSLTSQPASLNLDGVLYGATLSSDGSLMIYSDDNGLHTLDMEGGTNRDLLGAPGNGNVYVPLAAGPNGVVIVQLRSLSASDTPGTLGWMTLTQREWTPLPLPSEMESYGCFTGVGIDPVSGKVAVTGTRSGAACDTNPGMVVVDLESGTVEVVVDKPFTATVFNDMGLLSGAYTPAWSPDGSRIAFGLHEDATEESGFLVRLYVANPNGSGLTAVSDNFKGEATNPAWGDADTLYYSLNGAGEELDGIYRYNFSNGQNMLLISGSDLQPIAVAPTQDFLAFYNESGDLKAYIFSFGETIPVLNNSQGLPPRYIGWLLRDQ